MATAATLAVRLELGRQAGGRPMLVLFTVPIMLSATFGGLGPGLLATMLSVIGAVYYCPPPGGLLAAGATSYRWDLFFIALAGGVISGLNEKLHRALRRGDEGLLAWRQTAAELGASEAGLAAAQATAHLGSWELDLATMQCRYSAEMYRLFYLDPALGAPTFAEYIEHIHPDDRAAAREALARTAEAATPYSFEFRTRPDLGPARHLSAAIHVFRDAGGHAVRARGTTLDVTGRKQEERATRRALDRLQEAQRIGRIGDWEWDIGSQAIRWSPQVFEIYGRDPAQGPPRDDEENAAYYEGPSRKALADNVALAIKTGAPRDYDLSLRRPDGRRVRLHARAEPIWDAGGKVSGLRGTVQDVTKLHQAEEAAIQLAAIVESSEDAIIGKTLMGIVTSWNCAAEKLFGYTAAEMIGHSIMRLIPKDRHHEEARLLSLVGQGHSSRHCETMRLRKDGSAVDVSLTVSAIKDASGHIVGASKVAHDISAEKRTERALAASEVRYRRLFETAQDGILILDEATGMVVDVNPFLIDLLGFSHQEFLGKAIWQLGFFKDVVANEEHFAKLQARQYIRYEHLPLKTFDGRRIEVEFVSNVYEVNGAKVIQCNVRDVTVRRKTEAALQQLRENLEQRVVERTAQLARANHELEAYSSAVARDLRVAEAADQVKSAFLATMSHELRTPLNSILGFTGIVLKGMAGPLTPEQSKQLGMVRASARHLLELINDVLDLSKIEAGQLQVQRAPFRLPAALAHIVSLIQPLADHKGLTLAMAVSPEVGEIVSDRRRVEQILLNLLSNAVKFTEAGAVTLTARMAVDDPCAQDAGRGAAVRIEVADTGIGIRPEMFATLFQPFRQIDNALSRQNEGTGLGLAISRRLATLLGGEISAASEWARGSAFTLILPCP